MWTTCARCGVADGVEPARRGGDRRTRRLAQFLIDDLIYADLIPLDHEWVGVESYGVCETPPGVLLWLYGAEEVTSDTAGHHLTGRLNTATAVATAPQPWRDGIHHGLRRTRPDLLSAVGTFEASLDVDGVLTELHIGTPSYAGPSAELNQPETEMRLTLTRTEPREVTPPAEVDRMTAETLMRAVLGTEG